MHNDVFGPCRTDVDNIKPGKLVFGVIVYKDGSTSSSGVIWREEDEMGNISWKSADNRFGCEAKPSFVYEINVDNLLRDIKKYQTRKP